ncbi:OVARIAN TUMOR DOMAIN-containing deubiquitinating enzyme 7 [Sesamum angolense]|uniref:OVARIAN TUMOR DOMAIN-containing deubiquitinating enzyme 7 n=1 Tax=Sesamum angolense TaxID=2727404 RepID=A0AAE1XDR7_9LAMI|nr:OVARIAN TUMOR DOMAIN-containing deubiquitinating enzyme 7 [Sesamum angolense]
MAKAKHQKPKPSKEPKQPHIKRRGKQADTSDFRAQLDVLGLKIIEVTADGRWLINWKAMRMSMRSIGIWLFDLLRENVHND